MMPPHHHHEHNEPHEPHDYHHSHENALSNDHVDQHTLNMWKGLVAMMALVMFFFTEKALNMVAEWRKKRQRRNKVTRKANPPPHPLLCYVSL